MITFSNTILTAVAASALLLGLAACDNNTAEEAGKELDQAAEKAGEKFNEVAESLGEHIEDAGKDMQEAAREAKEARAVKEAKDAEDAALTGDQSPGDQN